MPGEADKKVIVRGKHGAGIDPRESRATASFPDALVWAGVSLCHSLAPSSSRIRAQALTGYKLPEPEPLYQQFLAWELDE